MAAQPTPHPNGSGSDATDGLARTGRALLSGVLGGVAAGATAVVIGVPAGGIAGLAGGTLTGVLLALLTPIVSWMRLSIVGTAMGVIAALTQVLMPPMLLGVGFGRLDIIAFTLPAAVVAGLTTAAAARWVITGQVRLGAAKT